jgi:hypothetical protein
MFLVVSLNPLIFLESFLELSFIKKLICLLHSQGKDRLRENNKNNPTIMKLSIFFIVPPGYSLFKTTPNPWNLR